MEEVPVAQAMAAGMRVAERVLAAGGREILASLEESGAG